MRNRRELLRAGLSATVVGLAGTRGTVADEGYTTVFYKSGELQIEAYLYKPDGDGPFPLIIYNHGTRGSQARKEVPFRYIGSMFRTAGYATLVPERRGYGKSDGHAAGGRYAAEGLHAESADVLAALDYVRTLPFVDQERLGMMGWSFGGIVTIFAIAQSNAFKVAIDQAGGALSWKQNAGIREALISAAMSVKTPVFFMDAQNDATTEAITQTAAVLQQTGTPHQVKIYPPFTPSADPGGIAPGHLIFGLEGVHFWRDDALAFFRAYL
jgi:dienelactone hydrolase